MSRIKPEVAQRRITSFTKRFGEAHLYLAYHAAFPLALTPDLLYGLWVNFQKDIQEQVLGIPWIAVGDLLLSALCSEVGHELYEMDLAVRNQLLNQLNSDQRFGKQRIKQLSDFLLEYARQQLHSDDPDIQDFAKTQQWIALAYTQPTQAARELALAFSNLNQQDKAEMVRMASLTETFTEPLSEFQPLLIYARGMDKFARGDLSAAKAEIKKALKKRNNIQIDDINLPIPEQIKPPLLRGVGRISRRQFLKWTGFGGVGLVTALVTRELSQTLQLQTFPFETVTVNAQGVEIQRRDGEAKYFVENLGNNLPLEMVQIPGGTFRMGSPPDEAQRSDAEQPEHQVTVPEFFMGKYAVTQAQYQAVMDKNPSNFKGENLPVETVSWNNAVEFCKKLSQNTGRTYRLPSEAEWEYACRADTTTPFHFGETITSELANYRGSETYASEPPGEYRQQTVEVDVESFLPNSFGLYQMHGNIWEWCLDTWHDNYQGAPSDGSAWIGNNQADVHPDWEQLDRLYSNLNSDNDSQSRRLLRGGSWYSVPWYCRSAYRVRSVPDLS
jgi:formylglycine-generating enzyme required for sulfatase activity